MQVIKARHNIPRNKVFLNTFTNFQFSTHNPHAHLEIPHLPSGSSNGFILNSWLTIISCARAMLETPLAVSINSSIETNLGGLAEEDREEEKNAAKPTNQIIILENYSCHYSYSLCLVKEV